MPANAVSLGFRLVDDDLLEVLKPRTLLIAITLSVLFAGVSMFLHAGRYVVIGVVAIGALVALFSPSRAFSLCVFLFAFRNEAFSMGPFKAADPLLLVTSVSWLAHLLYRGKIRVHYSLLIVGLYVLVSFLSGLQAQSVKYFLSDAIRLIYLVIIFILALHEMSRREVFISCVKSFLAAGLVMAVCSVMGALTLFLLHHNSAPFYDQGGEGGARFGWQSIAVDPQRVASFLIFPMLVACGLQQRGKTRKQRMIAACLFWLGFASCALSFSRSIVLQLVPGLGLMWLFTRHNLPKILLIATTVGIALLVVATVPPNSPLVTEYNLQRWAFAGKLSEKRSEPRLIVWDTCWRAFQSSPIIGVGLNNVYPRFFEFRDHWIAKGLLQWTAKPPHSTYLGHLAYIGIVGTAVFLGMLVYFLVLGRRALRAARADSDAMRYLVAAAALAAYVGQMVAGLAFELWNHNHVWIIMAILAVLTQPAEETAETEPAAASPAEAS